MRPAALCALALVSGCRDAVIADAGADAADVAPLTQGVAIGVFGAPTPDNGVPDPVVFVGCPTAGKAIAAIELFYLQPDGSTIDEGGHVATFTRTGSGSGTHDHIAIGTQLVVDLDETGADPNSAPFVYPATVTSDSSFYDTNAHSFVGHVLNPAMPSFDNLGAWNTDTLVACP